MDIKAADDWLIRYGRAWEKRDPQAAAALFAADALYYETPFSAPARGRAAIAGYWEIATRTQSQVHFRHEVLMVADRVVWAHWSAGFARDGRSVKLDGVFRLAFGHDGLCTELREWWHRSESER